MKMTGILPCLLLAATCLRAQPVETRQMATITGGPGPGRCVIEVGVDGTVEVALRDRQAIVRTLAGQPAVWRRFECNQPLPRNADGLMVRANRGRGQVRMSQAGRDGAAVIRIEDSKGGSDMYSFTVEWGGAPGPGGDRNGYGDGRRDGGGDRETRDRVARRCADAVQDRLARDEYQNVQISVAQVEDRPGRRGDRVLGRASGQGRWGVESFLFSCGVNFDDASIRGVDVVPQ